MKTLKELQDWADASDNVWLKNKLITLENELDIKMHFYSKDYPYWNGQI